MLSIIVAYDQQYGIGIRNTLPWRLSDDLKHFKTLTQGHYIVMGRKTFDSIGRPLPNRSNIILTQQINYRQKNCTVIHSVEKVIALVNEMPEQEIFIIGGAEIYRLFLMHVDRLYITKVKAKIAADVFFPHWDQKKFKCISVRSYHKSQDNDYDFDCEIWKRMTADVK